MAEMPSRKVKKLFWVVTHCNDRCTSNSWKRAQCYSTEFDEAINKFQRHLETSSNHQDVV